MIAIHDSKCAFSERWISYCERISVPYKIVDCYTDNIIEQLIDCQALMWHHDHSNSKDLLFSKQLLFSLEHSGLIVFPDFKTSWHFDDKLGQKYLFESLEIPHAKTHVFYKKKDAADWVQYAKFPVVFKLRGGYGSWNVFLISSKKEAIKYIRRGFGVGFRQYNAISHIKERWRKLNEGKDSVLTLLKGFVRIFWEPSYSRIKGREKGYVYFQEFIPDNDSDVRVIVIHKKAFAIKRLVRKNDFRASGSGNICYEKHLFDENTIRLAFEIADKIGGQSVAMDFVYESGTPKVVEVSYGFVASGYDKCPGYWDPEMNWYEGKFDPCEWMVDLVIDEIKIIKTNN